MNLDGYSGFVGPLVFQHVRNIRYLSCYISKDIVDSKGLNASTIVRELGKFIQGGGGGQPFYATAGGKNTDGISKALEQSKAYLN